MKAAYWTAFGAMAMPLGVSILALAMVSGFSDLSSFWVWLAMVFMVFGLLSFIAGWAYTIREERQNNEEYKLRCKEGELRIKREKASLKAIILVAGEFGVDISDEIDNELIE